MSSSSSKRLRLSAMMFLEYFIWGTWSVTLATYLGRTLAFTPVEIGVAYTTSATAAIVSPFFIGLVADRFLATERILALLHLAGAALLWAAGSLAHFGPLYLALLGYALVFMPTTALTNAISFAHLPDPATDFPRVRVLGTLGWIASGLLVGRLGLEATAIPLRIAGVSSLGMAIFCLTLPHTPPLGAARARSGGASGAGWARARRLLGLDALGLLRERQLAVFVAACFLVCIPLQFYGVFTNLYFNEIGIRAAAAKMTLGQATEGACMLVLPFLFPRLGVKRLMLLGTAAWVARYTLLALGGPGAGEALLLGAVLLHGACYVFILLTGQIYMEQRAPEHVRASAQGFFALLTSGFGCLIGGIAAGRLVQAMTHAGPGGALVHDWRGIWLVPAAGALTVLVAFAAAFRPAPAAAPEPALSAPAD